MAQHKYFQTIRSLNSFANHVGFKFFYSVESISKLPNKQMWPKVTMFYIDYSMEDICLLLKDIQINLNLRHKIV